MKRILKEFNGHISIQDKLIDTYISSKIESLCGRRLLIEPSDDFTRRTMSRIIKLERSMRQKRLMADVVFVGTALLPFIAQKVWLSMRHDAFAVSQLPLGHYIKMLYNIFLSPVAAMALLSVGILCALAYLANQYKWRFLSALSVMDFSRFISIREFSR